MKKTWLIEIVDKIVYVIDGNIDLLVNQIKRLIAIPPQGIWTKIYIHLVLSVVWFLVICICAVKWQEMIAFFDPRQWINGQIWSNGITIIIWKFLFFYPVLLLNIRWLIPNFWHKKQYLRYFLSIPAISICSAAIKLLLYKIDPRLLSDSGNYVVLLLVEILNVIIVLVISSTIKYVYENLAVSAKTLILERQKAQLQLQNTELRVAQLKPHFLLNSLNNIDTLLLKKSDKAQYALQCLSESLKYVLYDSNKQMIPLNDEIIHIQNIITLESLRFSTAPVIKFSQTGDTNNIQIPPLLLTPLIENCFKWLDNQNRWIDIDIVVLFGRVEATFSNSRNPCPTTSSSGKEKKGGLGLLRLRERLQMLYPKHHEKLLIVQDELPDSFSVKIKIPLV